MRTKFEINSERARTARADLEILSREQIRNLGELLHDLGRRYKAPLVAERYDEATIDDVARAAAKNLEGLVEDQFFIRGFNADNARIIEKELADLADFCRRFELRQPLHGWEQRLKDAVRDFLGAEVCRSGWAGSALRGQVS